MGYNSSSPKIRAIESEFRKEAERALNKRDLSLVEKALKFAKQIHESQTRDEGDPYIVHPLRVALSLVGEYKAKEAERICAALLHDVVEDGPVALEQLEKKFGRKIAEMVAALSKNKNLPPRERQGEFWRRFTNEPNETKFIKLLDRLDNMKYLSKSPNQEKIERYILETEKYYLPLAKEINESVYQRMKRSVEKIVSREDVD